MIKKFITTIGLITLLLVSINTQAETKITYFHNDLLGSPVSASDENGELLWRQNYQPYGSEIEVKAPNSQNDINYTGHQRDDESDLVYMQARYYDPVIGRFYSNDPVGYTSANPVMSFNRYLYVNNNPYKYTDPDGEFLNFAIGGIVGAAVEAFSQIATEGSVTNWTKVGAMGVAGTVSGGLSIATKGLSYGQKALAVGANTTIDATSQATASLISDGLAGNTEGSFANAGETALNAAAGPGKATVSATKGKLGVISKIAGVKTPTVNTGMKALDKTITETGKGLVKTAEGVAASKINYELKENN
ncbi:RHS repeat-associated core domain-containing protein [Colwellia sp. RSH04]|uniref:RHS repeat-associated core domain-containing protein n=1 Tax=Colwellia sp. RSH04 TaxID=2305464 RepID=UPI000E57A3BC|nr:RHS repeat-associated core domain-containing protein [Colwellia sp. RSH04]RHW77715.1 hypothetical protein D1094_01895 [Colwellia sp. RSH04]